MAMASLVSDGQLERFFSAYGLVVFSDHDDDGTSDTDVIADCKTYATAYFVGALADRYTYAQLASAAITFELVAVITLRELCLRRGNAPPASLEARYKEIVNEKGLIDRIRSGAVPLVDSSGERVPVKVKNAIQHANLQVDRRYSESQVRVVDTTSNMSPSKLKRFVDRWRDDY